MHIRKARVAGQFYPDQHDLCINLIYELLETITFDGILPETISGGIIPHAGWVFSGSLEGLFFSVLKQKYEKIQTFILLGAAHSYFGSMPAIYDKGFWETPLGQIAIDEDLAGVILRTESVVSDLKAHQSEHSIEVQVPFIQYFFPDSKILPILVPPNNKSIVLGESIGTIISNESDKKIVLAGSTDLTHYGPGYSFIPMGIGQQSLQWAHEVNDKKFIDTALKMDPSELLACAAENGNACGPGAAAAVISAVKKLGSEKGFLLAHTNSNEILQKSYGKASSESVGYATIIF